MQMFVCMFVTGTLSAQSEAAQSGLLLAVAIATAMSGAVDDIFFFFSAGALNVLVQMTEESEG